MSKLDFNFCYSFDVVFFLLRVKKDTSYFQKIFNQISQSKHS